MSRHGLRHFIIHLPVTTSHHWNKCYSGEWPRRRGFVVVALVDETPPVAMRLLDIDMYDCRDWVGASMLVVAVWAARLTSLQPVSSCAVIVIPFWLVGIIKLILRCTLYFPEFNMMCCPLFVFKFILRNMIISFSSIPVFCCKFCQCC